MDPTDFGDPTLNLHHEVDIGSFSNQLYYILDVFTACGKYIFNSYAHDHVTVLQSLWS